MHVETLAVNEISNRVGKCKHLVPYLAANDRTPLTDGHIDLHGEAKPSNANFLGRVPAQVKGRSRTRRGQSLRTYRIPRKDLLAYQADAGVLFFVVLIGPDPDDRTPYYALLSPFVIALLLREASPKATAISVPMKALPDDTESFERVVALALKTRAQRVDTGFDPVLFEKLESITVHSAADLSFDAPLTLNPGGGEVALVLHTTDGLSLPLDGILQIFPEDYATRTADVTVASGGVTFNSVDIRRLSAELVELRLAESLTLLIRGSGADMTTDISMTLASSLDERLKTMTFFVGLLDSRTIEIDGKASPFAISRSDDDAELRDHLAALTQLVELLEIFAVDTSLIAVDEIDDEQARQLNGLYPAFVQGKEVRDASLEPARILQRVGKWNVEFLTMRGSAKNKWRLVDPFAGETRHQFRWRAKGSSEREAVAVTAYDIIEEEHLPTMLNLRLDAVVSAYDAISEFPETVGLATQRILAFITAADTTPQRRSEFLDAATALNEWVITEDGENATHLINRWQILFRQGTLGSAHRKAIRSVKRSAFQGEAPDADLIELACAVLLAEDEEVADLWEQLSAEKITSTKHAWPIWKLHQLTSPVTNSPASEHPIDADDDAPLHA